MVENLKYDGKDDAEALLESVLCRGRWSVDIRDALALKLIQVHLGNRLRPNKKRNRYTPPANKINHV